MYDSFRSKRLPFDTKEQIASLLHCQETSFSLEYANVQVGRFIKNLFNYDYIDIHILHDTAWFSIIELFVYKLATVIIIIILLKPTKKIVEILQ